MKKILKPKSYKHMKQALTKSIKENHGHKDVSQLYWWLHGVTLGMEISGTITKRTYTDLDKFMENLFREEIPAKRGILFNTEAYGRWKTTTEVFKGIKDE